MVLGVLVRGNHGKTHLFDSTGLTAALGIGGTRVIVDLSIDGHCVVKFEDGNRGHSYDVFRDNVFDTLERQAKEGG